MLQFKSPTNKTQKIKLDSSIQLVMWSKSNAVIGSNVSLEVLTNFIGNNSDISIDISDKSGKKFQTIKGKIFGNKFWTDVLIPENAKDELYAEVKLPKHGLALKSKPLFLVPPIIIKNLKWSKSEVRRGDILKFSADISGVPDGVEVISGIWEFSSKSYELITEFPLLVKKGRIEGEWEFQYPGDINEIPIYSETSEGYQHPGFFFRLSVANTSADSEIIKFYDFLDFRLIDAFKEPVPNVEYTLHLPDGSKRTGKVDEAGKVHEEDLPPGRLRIEVKGLENTAIR